MGICRGMQLLAKIGGSELIPVSGHVGLKHYLYGEMNHEVICYHNFAINKVPENFEVLAKSKDGLIECIKHKELPWEGWMWHPERIKYFSKYDVERIKKLFG